MRWTGAIRRAAVVCALLAAGVGGCSRGDEPAADAKAGGDTRLSRDHGAGDSASGRDLPTADASPARYRRLSQTGLYSDIATKSIAPSATAYTPGYRLWSDGASKRRWIKLPSGKRIDSSKLDRWRFPVGTQLFKEFSRNGRLLETRLVERIGDSGDPARDYWMGAFIWLEDQSDAVFARAGRDNVLGTQHDVPAANRCPTCHGGEPGRVLGFSALQLAEAPQQALGLDSVVKKGWLSDPPAQGDLPRVPGDATTRAALGYMHANCGSCHDSGTSAALRTDLRLRVGASERMVAATGAYRTAVGKSPMSFFDARFKRLVDPGKPTSSSLLYRMTVRGNRDQMPPIATEKVDSAGVKLVRAWIASLSP